jgi:serine/threonine-protein kinase
MNLHTGERVGPYEVLAPIGQGGMAHVYKDLHPKLNRIVALKMVLPIHAQNRGFMERFEREARIVASLEHPHIVPLYDYDEHEGQLYLAMKFIEGSSLKEVMALGNVPINQIATVLRPVASALDYAHRQGILHRDVKPSNIMIDKNGSPYLADFGLARASQAGSSTISADMLLGTPHYMAPEQAQGISDLTNAVDIYALGVVLYEMLVGEVPFQADTPYAIIHQHITAPPPSLRQFTSIPPQVENVIWRALAKDPLDRYATANAMLDDYEASASGVARKPIKRLNASPQPVSPQEISDAKSVATSPKATEILPEKTKSSSIAKATAPSVGNQSLAKSLAQSKQASAVAPAPAPLAISPQSGRIPIVPSISAPVPSVMDERDLLHLVEGRLQRRNLFMLHALLFLPAIGFVWWAYGGIRMRYYEFWFRFPYHIAISILWAGALVVHALHTYTHSDLRARQRHQTARRWLQEHYGTMDLQGVPSNVWQGLTQFLLQRDEKLYRVFAHLVVFVVVTAVLWLAHGFWRNAIWNLFPYHLVSLVGWGIIWMAHMIWTLQSLVSAKSLMSALERERNRLKEQGL